MFLASALAILSAASCDGEPVLLRESCVLMGTVVEVTLAVPAGDEERGRGIAAEAFREIERIDRDFAWQNPVGELGRLNAAAVTGHTAAISRELGQVLRAALAVAAESEGAFDPTVGPLTALWGFDGVGAGVPNMAMLAKAKTKVGHRMLHLGPRHTEVGIDVDGMSLDLGAIAKGHAVDRAVEILKARGVQAAIVDAGGDLRLLGGRPGKGTWGIGVQDPRDRGRLLFRFDLADTAIVTSGDYERYFEVGGVRYHHILDPATGMPARGCRSVTVIAPTAAEADACATAAFVLGPERGIAFLRSRPGVRGLIVDALGALRWTDAALEREAIR